MSEIKNLKIRYSDGKTEECSIEIIQQPQWKLIYLGAGLQEQEFAGADLFDALVELRKTLEKIGIQLLCAGARRDVYPSGMSRDMSGGRKAYVTSLGRPALRTALLDIFDSADYELVGSVAEQQMFHEKWVASLRK